MPAPAAPNEPIAIVGIGIRFPGEANDPASYWALVRDGVDAITEVPADRWNIARHFDPTPGRPGKTYAKWGGFIRGIDQFDPEPFGIAPREVAYIDPQQRLALEVAYEALEDAGAPRERLVGSRTGVFVGISHGDYAHLHASAFDARAIDARAPTGGAFSIAANRVSYAFDLKGPSLAVDTACSSALVAVHLARTSLLAGECDLALAGGVNVVLLPETFVGFSAASMLSPTGRCRAFDAAADGFVRAEGAGFVVLKPLRRALADGDRIYATLRGTAVNQDGRTSGIMMPSEASQEALVREACRVAGVAPRDVAFVEAHGTGTPVGDPIEARALGRALGEGRPSGAPCIIGAVKCNVGHLESAAGIAGFVKAVLALHRRAIPPVLHFTRPNEHIDFDALSLRVPTKLEPWPHDESRVALAGVNAFGFGGTNAHAVLAEHRPLPRPSAVVHGVGGGPARALVLPLSAETAEGLAATARAVREHVATDRGTDDALADLCRTAALRRDALDHRVVVTVESRTAMIDRLDAFLAGESRPGLATGRRAKAHTPRLAFVFTGQGAQRPGMGRELLAREPAFRDAVEACDAILRPLAGRSIIDELVADGPTSRMDEPGVSQPAIFVLEVGIAALLRRFGVVPDVVVGHSVGEIAAAHVAGALSLEDAARFVFRRGQAMERARRDGRMLAAGLSPEAALQRIAPYDGRVALAAVNAPCSVTLSGDPEPLDELRRGLDAEGVFCRALPVARAFHSGHMTPLREEILDGLRALAPRAGTVPFVSSVVGAHVAGESLDAAYWWRNVRDRVEFGPAIASLLADESDGAIRADAFLEIGPHPILSRYVHEVLAAKGKRAAVLSTLARDASERVSIHAAVGALHAIGRPVHLDALWPEGGEVVSLPRHVWRRSRHWHECEESAERRLGPREHPLLGHPLRGIDRAWETPLDLRLLPFLRDHRVEGHVVLPAAAYVELAFAAARSTDDRGVPSVENLRLERALFIPEASEQAEQDVAPILQTRLAADGQLGIDSRPAVATASWERHGAATVRVLPRAGVEASVRDADLDAIERRLTDDLPIDARHEAIRRRGLDFGPAFRSIVRLRRGDGEAIGRVALPEGIPFSDYLVHPAILDAGFQVLSAAIARDDDAADRMAETLFLPVHIERARFFHAPGGRATCHARCTASTSRAFSGDIRVFDAEGRLCIEIVGLRCRAVSGPRRAAGPGQWFYETRWEQRPRPEPDETPRRAPSFPGARALADATTGEVLSIAVRHGDYLRRGGGAAALDDVTRRYVERAFAAAALHAGEHVSIDDLLRRLGAPSSRRSYVAGLAEILAREGPLRRVVDGRYLVERPPAPDDPLAAWRDGLAQFPAFLAEWDLVGRFGEQVSRLVRGEVEPLAVLFPEGSAATSEHLYQDSPTFARYNSAARRIVERLVAALPVERTLRVLEVGGGTGGLAAHVLPAFPARRTEYVFTDVSNAFFARARRRFREHEFVRYEVFDAEKDPGAQGFAPHGFDLVLASNVLHATRRLRESIAHLERLLAPGGRLVLLEASPGHAWADLVFGATDGWWRREDHDVRPEHPLIPARRWVELLRERFEDVAAVDWSACGGPAGQQVIVADAPTVAPAPDAPAIAPAPAQPVAAAGRWLLFADAGGVAERLARRFEASGSPCVTVTPGPEFRKVGPSAFEASPDRPLDMAALVAAIHAMSGGPLRGAVHLWSLRAGGESRSSASLAHAEALGCHSVMHWVQALRRAEPRAERAVPPRLVLVTRGAQCVGERPTEVAVEQSPLVGLARLLASECPDLAPRTIDLAPLGPNERDRAAERIEEAAALFAEIHTQDPEDEVALRPFSRFVPRARRSPRLHAPPTRRDPAASARAPFRFEVSAPGALEGFAARRLARRTPGPGEIEIEVRVAGMNFRDVLKVMGLYPGDDAGALLLGDECAGRVVAVGPDVARFACGDDVVAIAPGSFASHVVTRADAAIHVPEGWTLREAATAPIAFSTACWALEDVGRLAKGERVLVHSAAGGVGLAAMQVARALGAEVFATAGSEERRGLVRRIAATEAFDSRSLSFADATRAATGGRGVDVVLNSLAGAAIPAGIATLAPFGRFVEIGRRDVFADARIGLLPFQRNLALHVVDLGRLLPDRPDELRRLLDRIGRRAADRTFAPLPNRQFDASKLLDALRLMAAGVHVGKVLVAMDDAPEPEDPIGGDGVRFASDASYLLVGGLGGFGGIVARWMIARGARHLVLMGRRAGSESARREADDLAAAGAASIALVAGDVAERADVARAAARAREGGRPLRGVFHMAMVMDDGVVEHLDRTRFRNVTRVKVDGTSHLHEETLADPLDHFVLFSSIATLLGNQGQASYVAANAFLDAFAGYRRAQGRPGIAIHWGRLDGVGYVAERDDVGKILSRWGVNGLSPVEAMDALSEVIARNPVNPAVVNIDWRKWASRQVGGRSAKRISALVEEAADVGDAADAKGKPREALLRAAPAERASTALAYVREQAARVLGASAARLDVERPLAEMGLDSLMAVELKNRLEADLAISLAGGEWTKGPTVASLAAAVLARIGGPSSAVPAAVAPDGSAPGVAPAPIVEPESSPLVLLRAGDARPALFCIHAGGGSVDVYRALADAVPAGRPIYGIRSRLVAGAAHEHATLDALAKAYAAAIRRAEPEGPHAVVGWSLGGFFAQAVAHALEVSGDEVALVGVVDSDPRWLDPAASRAPALAALILDLYALLERELDIVKPADPSTLALEVAVVAREVALADEGARAEPVVRWLRGSGRLRREVDPEIVRRYLARLDMHDALVRGLRPPPLAAPVLHWWAARGLFDDAPAATNGHASTGRAAPGRTLAGTHRSIMEAPLVTEIAADIEAALTSGGRRESAAHATTESAARQALS